MKTTVHGFLVPGNALAGDVGDFPVRTGRQAGRLAHFYLDMRLRKL